MRISGRFPFLCLTGSSAELRVRHIDLSDIRSFVGRIEASRVSRLNPGCKSGEGSPGGHAVFLFFPHPLHRLVAGISKGVLHMSIRELVKQLEMHELDLSDMEVKDLSLWWTRPKVRKCVTISFYGSQEDLADLYRRLNGIVPPRDFPPLLPK